MASFTIEKRTKSNGDFSYRCKIVVKQNNAIIHRESKTFRKKELARTFGKKRIQEIENEELGIKKSVTLGELLDLYIEDRLLWDNTGRTKRYVIQMLRDCDIAKLPSNKLLYFIIFVLVRDLPTFALLVCVCRHLSRQFYLPERFSNMQPPLSLFESRYQKCI